jgi:hypothetical protein
MAKAVLLCASIKPEMEQKHSLNEGVKKSNGFKKLEILRTFSYTTKYGNFSLLCLSLHAYGVGKGFMEGATVIFFYRKDLVSV